MSSMGTASNSRRTCKVAVVQMTSTPDKETTFKQAKSFVEKAHADGAKVVFLPEACDFVGNSREYTLSSAEDLKGEILTRYKTMAANLGVWISLGGLHIKTDDERRLSNTHVLVDSKGQIASTYSKTHLFNVDIPGKVRLKETDFTCPGASIGPPIDSPAGKIGLAVCYDMRFPELSTGLQQQGAEILTYPSAFTIPTGNAHWEVLLRARAIENQCYVIAAAQVGQHHPKRASYGHAMVVDPWGVVLADLGDEVGVKVVEVDLDALHTRRLEMPLQEHRRYDLYGPTHFNTRVDIDAVDKYQFGQVSVPSSCVFYRTALSFAFVNKMPIIPGHVLVSPIRVVPRYDDLTAAEVSDLALTAHTTSRVIEKHHGCTSRTFGLQDGPEAGQTIQHVHCHILPRRAGDFERNDEIYEKIESHDKPSSQREARTEKDMAEEASILRKLFV